jgi:DNA polymerase-3 subunit delta'
MTSELIPEADRAAGLAHPRETAQLFGHRAAEEAILAAAASGRLHHAWLVAGAEGVGKATLCWKIARFLLCRPMGGESDGLFGTAPPPATTLDVDPGHPVARRMQALAEPRLFLLRRPWDDKAGRLRSEITVEEVRRMKSFFGLSAADGGTRVAIIDAADDLNPSAANALLKLLEEPPAAAVFLLVSHQPARLLPTIRSRCRTLRLAPLAPPELARALAAALGTTPDDGTAQETAELAGGSVGAAARLAMAEGAGLYREMTALCAGMPGVDRPRLVALAERLAARGAEARFDLAIGLLDRLLARAARHGATGRTEVEAAPGEAALLDRLSPDAAAGRRWADLAQTLGQRVRAGRAVNLDPAALLIDMVLKIDAEAGRLARR